MSECCIDFPNCHCARYKGSSSKPAAPTRYDLSKTQKGLLDAINEFQPPKDAGARSLIERVKDYLGNGGLFNPELMEHQKVRDLIVDLRAAYEKLERNFNQVEHARELCDKECEKLERDLNGALKHLEVQTNAFTQERTKSTALVEALELTVRHLEQHDPNDFILEPMRATIAKFKGAE